MPPKTYLFLGANHVKRLYATLIANATPSQPNLLESAVASPMNVKYYGQDNLFQLAASLSEKIIKNHAFADGNKRVALVAADMFLKINGHRLQRSLLAVDDSNNQNLENAHVQVATSRWSAEQLGAYYESIATPIDEWTQEILQFRNGATEY